MALTPPGAELIFGSVMNDPNQRPTLVRITSTDGQVAEAAVVDHTIAMTAGGATLTVRAVFGDHEANFEWARRDLVSASGVVIDTEAKDAGRKVLGAIWEVEIPMFLGAPA